MADTLTGRLQNDGFPYRLDFASQMWSVLMQDPTGIGGIPVVAFTDHENSLGIYVGWHNSIEEARHAADRARRRRGVTGVSIVTGLEIFE